MTISMKRATFLLSGTIAAGMYGGVAVAADISSPGPLPAVSAINGKVVLGGGWADVDTLGNDEIFRGGAALSFPVGDMLASRPTSRPRCLWRHGGGRALHAFTRDPNSYLLGAYGGYVGIGSTDVWYVGPEPNSISTISRSKRRPATWM